jgi:hypothetical protein
MTAVLLDKFANQTEILLVLFPRGNYAYAYRSCILLFFLPTSWHFERLSVRVDRGSHIHISYMFTVWHLVEKEQKESKEEDINV